MPSHQLRPVLPCDQLPISANIEFFNIIGRNVVLDGFTEKWSNVFWYTSVTDQEATSALHAPPSLIVFVVKIIRYE